MIFHAKFGIWGKYLYVSHTLFILYLEGNDTLFGEKLYSIWKFSSGNTAIHLSYKTGNFEALFKIPKSTTTTKNHFIGTNRFYTD